MGLWVPIEFLLPQGLIMYSWPTGICYIGQAGQEFVLFLDFLSTGITQIYHLHFALYFILIWSFMFIIQASLELTILLLIPQVLEFYMWATTANFLEVF